MLIGGLQPVTLLDYPKKVAAIVFTSGCNMRCPFCYNFKLVLPELIKDDTLYKEAEVVDFLLRRKKYLDGLVISGGEPTLQKDLPEFLRKMKAVGYEIKLDTNGLDTATIENLLAEKLVDYIAMDIKGPFDDYEKFSGVKPGSVKKTIELIINCGLPYEFRSTLVKNLHQKEDIKAMAEMISGAKLYYLQNYNGTGPLAGARFSGRPFLQKEMKEFKKLAEAYVKNCQIR